MATRPKNEEELQKREVIGVIRASRFVRKYARSHKPITLATVREMHGKIFGEAWSEIAGVYRDENLKITDSSHRPPHFSKVSDAMDEAEDQLQIRLEEIKCAEGVIQEGQDEEKVMESVDKVVRVAAWLHHIVTFIHPFREGNGRTARLATNLILERYGLVGLSIKIEQQNKNAYRKALAQIDQHQDFEPLVELIYDGLVDRYDGVAVKYYDLPR